MTTTGVLTHEISEEMSRALDGIVRCYWYVSDAVRPPAVVIGQPAIDYLDTDSGFCAATWTFPLTLVVARNNDREAQLSLSRNLQAITSALDAADLAGTRSCEPVDARPLTVSISGQDLPGYAITVRVRA
jgi:hypothetical protein